MKKENVKRLDVVFILDKSGSMQGSEQATITSFNEYLEKEKKNKYPTYITTILFNDSYNYLHKDIIVSNVKPITKEDYCVSGCTALYDALGNAINEVEQKETDKVLFVIITDGYENASKEYSKDKIKKLINKHSKWEFIYIGADIDSYAVGGELGIRKENIANYKKSGKGVKKLFKAISDYECAMVSNECASDNWKKELE